MARSLPLFLYTLPGPDPSVPDLFGTGIQTNTLGKAYIYFVWMVEMKQINIFI